MGGGGRRRRVCSWRGRRWQVSQEAGGTQFTCFTGTEVQILTLRGASQAYALGPAEFREACPELTSPQASGGGGSVHGAGSGHVFQFGG